MEDEPKSKPTTATEKSNEDAPTSTQAENVEQHETTITDKADQIVEAVETSVYKGDEGQATKHEAASELVDLLDEATKPESEIDKTIVAVALETYSVKNNFDDGPVEDDPIGVSIDRGKTEVLVDGVSALAKEGDTTTAETAAEDIDRAEAYQLKIESLESDKSKSTTEIFLTVSLEGKDKQQAKEITDQPKNWDPERHKLHESLFEKAYAESKALSERLFKKRGYHVVLALRGSPGSGKTTALRNGNQIFDGILDDTNKPSGSVAPDVFKPGLRGESDISSDQVHQESTMLGRRLSRELMNDPNASLVYDKLMNGMDDIAEMIDGAKRTGKKVGMLDIDVPLEVSAVRVLSREKNGADPNINFKGVSAGFIGIRMNRSGTIDALQKAGPKLVEGYVLMGFDPETKQSVPVATFHEGKLMVHKGRRDLYDSITKQSGESVSTEVESVRNQVVNEEFIQRYVSTYFNPDDPNSQQFIESVVKTLRGYVRDPAITLGQALDEKAK